MSYHHRQTATFGPLLLLGVLVVTGVIVVAAGAWAAIIPLAVVFAVVAAFMSRLTVVVDDTSVVATMGWRWPRRRIALADVVSARRVRNEWWRGWGIRYVRRGWMYNIAGRESVELELRTGRVFRIGTDDPDGLLAAIQSSIAPS